MGEEVTRAEVSKWNRRSAEALGQLPFGGSDLPVFQACSFKKVARGQAGTEPKGLRAGTPVEGGKRAAGTKDADPVLEPSRFFSLLMSLDHFYPETFFCGFLS